MIHTTNNGKRRVEERPLLSLRDIYKTYVMGDEEIHALRGVICLAIPHCRWTRKAKDVTL